MQNYVEFYFPGTSCAGQNEREIASRDITAIGSVPQNAVSCRFYSKDEEENKINYSPYHFFGTEYSAEEFKIKYPQMVTSADSDLAIANRIVKTTTGGFYPLSDTDIVVPA